MRWQRMMTQWSCLFLMLLRLEKLRYFCCFKLIFLLQNKFVTILKYSIYCWRQRPRDLSFSHQDGPLSRCSLQQLLDESRLVVAGSGNSILRLHSSLQNSSQTVSCSPLTLFISRSPRHPNITQVPPSSSSFMTFGLFSSLSPYLCLWGVAWRG